MKKLLSFTIILAMQVSCISEDTDRIILTTDTNLHLDNGELFYKTKLFSGMLIDYYKNDQIKSKVIYVDGRKEGEEQSFYENGELRTKRFYRKGIKVGIHEGWWPDNHHKFVYHFNEEGKYHGSVMEWYTNGQLLKSFRFNHGKEEGKQQLFRSDGNIRANYEVIRGERFGLIGLKKCYTIKKDSTKIY
ncbi:antitoxin component YwqK of YwqJK toxin-antitoxin module [Aquimarina sp. EL_43]|uniref:toxin-antitoxin system YwqK family antitoxin n=1 Tax=unclassified Aquimarina TaxID=2627091 RepID=UPI0018CBBEB3|nr:MULTISPECIES: hypothetical protein [unclassified Aquimarina]MBG6132265.1 antitoxin component YwqK of YwqJK toxin-antitoxin module [Aquimarina sp. EL_35]MBG6153749.1 antitoxin component YwqK of YwqJK toxin-antitoxin module [Aquimarina sp. EL_32]MBG6171905.1 antitoxin component YwqK of YwqJK toxin-antitoxin module [Aquimarina sp. EL_43]